MISILPPPPRLGIILLNVLLLCSSVSGTIRSVHDRQLSNRRLHESSAFVSANRARSLDEDSSEFRSSTIVVEMSPINRLFNTAEVAMFSSSAKYFYEQIFESQSDYNVSVKNVDIVKQLASSDDTNNLLLETVVGVNFVPKDDTQQLTNDELRRILVHLLNKFDYHLLKHLRGQDSIFDTVAIEVANVDSLNGGVSMNELGTTTTTVQGSNPDSTVWSIVAITCGSLIMAVALFASYRLYRREAGFTKMEKASKRFSALQKRPRFKRDKVANNDRRTISPFRDPLELPDKDALLIDDAPSSHSDHSAYIPSDDFLFPPDSSRPHRNSPRRVDFVDLLDHHNDKEGEKSKTRLSLDDNTTQQQLQDEMEPMVTTENVIWAPAGKLGVAVDVVDGHPVVHRIKPGSPLEGFMAKMDRIVAIDDIDTTCMSAADVTQLMVKRMNERRKITYVRGGRN